MADPLVVLAAALMEGAVGYPERLHRRLPHPVAWLGWMISRLERAWNLATYSEGARRLLGVLALLVVTSSAVGVGWLIEGLAGDGWVGAAIIAAVGTLGLAGRSLYDHVASVAQPLSRGDLPEARLAVSRIVGRDVERLDTGGVAAAALESLAESFSDGLVAPLFWFLVGGLPGLFAYKAVNTADSLIGHMEVRWRMFGWAAARTDDLMNLIPARLSGALIAGLNREAWRVMRRDARRHASPNGGWPEAAMAGALGVTLGGPTAYDGVMQDRATLGEGPTPTPDDLRRGLGLYLRACLILAAVLLAGGLVWPR